ncbi:MAG: 6-phospho-beta-glucosidase, partial [Candidatus Asgardarchaeia archaeon]
MKICIIGGGGVLSPEVIRGILKKNIDVEKVVFMDINLERAKIVRNFCERMVRKRGLNIELEATKDAEYGISDSDFVLTQFRVGGLKGRIIDEKVPLRYGVIGHENTGPGGFSLALRTIPVVLEYARKVEEYAPKAWLINFMNPAGLITEAIHRSSKVKVVGLCDAPLNYISAIAKLFGVKKEDVFLDYVGLNHLSWIRHVYVKGKDVTEKVIELVFCEEKRYGLFKKFKMNYGIVKVLNMLYHGILSFYYERDEILDQIIKKGKTRGEEVLEIEEKVFKSYSDPKISEMPPILSKRGGAMYSDAALNLMDSILNDRRDVQIVNVPNDGAVKGLDDDNVVEIPCLITGKGPIPLKMGEIEPEIRGLIQVVKAYEELTIRAAMSGSYRDAIKAL